jgi:hypothetical protein
MEARTRLIAIGIGVAVAGAAAGWWAYGAHQKRELRKTIVALVADGAARMRGTLTAPDAPDAAPRDEANAAAAERGLAQLKTLDAAREQALADAADAYLHNGREILKRVVEGRRYRQLLTDSLQALDGHMRADDRSAAWVQEAVKARERVNGDYRGYSTAATVLDQLLRSLPEAQSRIAPHVDPALLLDAAAIDAVRNRTLAAAKQAEAEVARTRKLEAFR